MKLLILRLLYKFIIQSVVHFFLMITILWIVSRYATISFDEDNKKTKQNVNNIDQKNWLGKK